MYEIGFFCSEKGQPLSHISFNTLCLRLEFQPTFINEQQGRELHSAKAICQLEESNR